MRYDYVVLGAGVAGLAFAYEVARNEKSVLILEKEKQVGGLSRTFEYKGFRFDFCAHRFHTGNEGLLETVKELVGPSFKKHIKKSRIYIFNRYLKYPFELPNLLRAMDPVRSVCVGFSFLSNLILTQAKSTKAKKDSFKSYKDWFTYYFGAELYKIMCEPYTSKIWRTDPCYISADWADQRFEGIKIRKLIKKAIKKLLALDFSSYSLEDDRLAPDGGEFYYGESGAQEIPDAFKKRIIECGSKIMTDVKLTKVCENKLEVHFEACAEEKVAYAKEAIITTIPLHTCYELIVRDKKEDDPDIERTLNKTRYMDIIFVYLLLNKKQVSNDHWLYFPDKDIIFNRSVEFKNWSKKMAPPDKTALCLDITCYEGDPTWNNTDEELVKECINSAKKAKLLKPEEVVDSKVMRVKYAYPFYDLDYKEKIEKIIDVIENSNKIFCLGRTGLFRYNNSDNSIEMGFELAKRLLNNNRESLNDYVIKNISY